MLENAAAAYATQICGYIYALTAVVMPIGTAAKDPAEAFSRFRGQACPHVKQQCRITSSTGMLLGCVKVSHQSQHTAASQHLLGSSPLKDPKLTLGS